MRFKETAKEKKGLHFMAEELYIEDLKKIAEEILICAKEILRFRVNINIIL